ncbi:exopolysaccharide biosynthesis polyprenyl glycosylphosphotransferase [Antarcticibacterium flavum]|uniref:Exopolysaccharide biosynthesis polyprenyl glycosylphosphotransferase n=2 Tax=Flavobacteriaceae TaxID=49546 RepID=A0A5B7X9I4_9FLAO|nr:exopolysaccharide biosynthesis polyprenyl glycosylphosphotransferase [Antarcticibacterium sp. W02-3]MCM4161379.1 sugar transferase [Antarcticibacterium sp. W02-3]QCY71462.1 exopolysaccharide biosynthesis polyprenyl glycosylphosphotransferase [Antarcticibacterium flavum]
MPQKSLVHFEISERKVLLRLIDNVAVLFCLSLVGIIFDYAYFKVTDYQWEWVFMLLLYLNIFSTIFELYDLQQAGRFEAVLKNVILTSSLTLLFFILTPRLTPSLPDYRIQILFFFLTMTGALLLWRYAYITLISSARFYKRVLLIGDAGELDVMVEALQKSDPNYAVIGYINTSHSNKLPHSPDLLQFTAEELSFVLKDQHINEVVVAGSAVKNKGVSISLLEELNNLLIEGVSIKDYTQVYEDITYRVPVQHIGNDFYKFFLFSRSNQNKLYRFFHRMFDIFTAIIGLLLCALIIPFVWLGNLFGNKGCLFYTQERIGKNAIPFNILKFRTMPENSEPNGPQWSPKNDQRISWFGRLLRRTRIDEFPQFYNILKGEMSVIGPRPERPVFVKELSEMIPFYKTRHIIKPGLTGWAQVKANYGSSHDDSLEKLQYDLYYIKHRGLFLDLNILLKTFSTVLFFRGH